MEGYLPDTNVEEAKGHAAKPKKGNGGPTGFGLQKKKATENKITKNRAKAKVARQSRKANRGK